MTILELIQQVITHSKGEAVMAWVQFLPAILSAGQAIYGGISEGRKRRQMGNEMNKWNAENEALYNKEYHSDYTQRADVQNIIRQMREESDRNRKIDEGKQVITGGTPQQALASQDRRNKAMSNLFSNLAGQGARHKDNVQGRYLNRKYGLQGMKYDDMSQDAASSGNMMNNGIQGLLGSDWAGILGGGNISNNSYRPNKISTPSTPLLKTTGGPTIPSNFDFSKLPNQNTN